MGNVISMKLQYIFVAAFESQLISTYGLDSPPLGQHRQKSTTTAVRTTQATTTAATTASTSAITLQGISMLQNGSLGTYLFICATYYWTGLDH